MFLTVWKRKLVCNKYALLGFVLVPEGPLQCLIGNMLPSCTVCSLHLNFDFQGDNQQQLYLLPVLMCLVRRRVSRVFSESFVSQSSFRLKEILREWNGVHSKWRAAIFTFLNFFCSGAEASQLTYYNFFIIWTLVANFVLGRKLIV